MMIYGTQPERALTIVDSALIVGNVSPFRADFIRAKIYANSLEKQELNKAIDLCEGLLRNDSTQVVDNATFANRSNVLGVMMDACRKKGDEERWLQFAIERAELNRSHGMLTEALRMEAEIGAAMTHVGRREEGLIKLEHVIRTVDTGAPSLDRMDALIIALKRRINVFEMAGRFQDMITDAKAIISKLEDYRDRPSAYAHDSFRLTKGTDMGRYCDFYTAQAMAYLARAYAHMTPPNIPEVRKYASLVEKSEFGRTFGIRSMLTPAWKALGQWDKLMAVDADAESRMGNDTINVAYSAILKDRADEARARGHFVQAISYMERYTRLQEQLNEKRQETEAQNYAARYHALEQDREIQEEKARSKRKDTIIAIISVLMLLAALFAFFSIRHHRSILEKNRALARMISELSESQASSKAESPKPSREQFDLIDRTVREEKLYTNINLQRQDIVDRFNINRHAMNDLFTAFAGGQSFTAYINNLRLQDAVRLLQDEPEHSISDIAEAVGFSPATLREQFKHQYGMTPTEYRQNL